MIANFANQSALQSCITTRTAARDVSQHRRSSADPMKSTMQFPLLSVALIVGFPSQYGFADGKPLKVFILAGQSNMQGSAHQRTFAAIGDDPQSAPLLEDILQGNGQPVVSGKTFMRFGKSLAEAMLDLENR